MYIQQADISLAPLDAANICSIKIASMCEFLLRKTKFLAILANSVSKVSLLSIFRVAPHIEDQTKRMTMSPRTISILTAGDR